MMNMLADATPGAAAARLFAGALLSLRCWFALEFLHVPDVVSCLKL